MRAARNTRKGHHRRLAILDGGPEVIDRALRARDRVLLGVRLLVAPRSVPNWITCVWLLKKRTDSEEERELILNRLRISSVKTGISK